MVSATFQRVPEAGVSMTADGAVLPTVIATVSVAVAAPVSVTRRVAVETPVPV